MNSEPRRYDSYFSVEYDYVKELPLGWKLVPNIAIFAERIERGGEDFELLSISISKGVVRQSDMDKKDISSDDKSNYKVVRKGDIAYGMEFRKGAVGHSIFDGIVSPVYTILKPKYKVRFNPVFFHYMFRSEFYRNYIKRYVYGIGEHFLPLRYKDFKRMYSIVPPLETQDRIVRFLNKEVTNISEFVRKKQELITLMQGQKRAVITKLVTSGISGGEKQRCDKDLIGALPKHWGVIRLKYACELLRDGTHLPPPRVVEGYPLLSVRNLVDGGHIQFLEDDSNISKKDFLKLERSFSVKAGDILLAIVGATIGKVSVVPEMEPFSIQRSVGIFRTRQKVLRSKFLFYFLQSNCFQSVLWQHSGYSAQPGIYLGSLADFFAPLPPLEEQEQIVSAIESEVERINSAITKLRNEIELIEEYRHSLTKRVITGELSVH